MTKNPLASLKTGTKNPTAALLQPANHFLIFRIPVLILPDPKEGNGVVPDPYLELGEEEEAKILSGIGGEKKEQSTAVGRTTAGAGRRRDFGEGGRSREGGRSADVLELSDTRNERD
ncbi:hypothetical protein LXL04_038726 [Taraxacum kok-saghyz]